jgi:hypothetical protein
MDINDLTYLPMQTQEVLCHCEERNDETISINSEIAAPSGLAMTEKIARFRNR